MSQAVSNPASVAELAPHSTGSSEPLGVIASIDIGTNSIRLEVCRVEPDHSLSTLSLQKVMVRLGDHEFETGHLTAAAIERGVLVCARFSDIAKRYRATETVAFATSAVREAENRDEFLHRVEQEAGLKVKVISGPEEARLIYLGVVDGADIGDRNGLFIDIGGGSTELILGDAQECYTLESLKLGAVRLANLFPPGERGSYSVERFSKIKAYARAVAGHTVRQIARRGFDVVYGSAGTITNLAGATLRRLGETPTTIRNRVVKSSDLRDTVEMLCRMSLEERAGVPGINPERADIIIGGAAVLMALLEDLSIERISISDQGLRRGMVLDRIMQEPGYNVGPARQPVRVRSILQLARTTGFDEAHARHVADLARSLFDQLRALGLHRYDDRERELLEYSSLVHDIGCFLSHTNHQKHAYYLVRHSDLLGFNDSEIDIIANVAYYHRKGSPRKKHDNLSSLTSAERKVVAALAAILRVAEGLDRSHMRLVDSVRLTPARSPERLILTARSAADCQLELWGVETNRALFEETFGRPLTVCVEHYEHGAAVGASAARAVS